MTGSSSRITSASIPRWPVNTWALNTLSRTLPRRPRGVHQSQSELRLRSVEAGKSFASVGKKSSMYVNAKPTYLPGRYWRGV
jgi:hypothetical protein